MKSKKRAQGEANGGISLPAALVVLLEKIVDKMRLALNAFYAFSQKALWGPYTNKLTLLPETVCSKRAGTLENSFFDVIIPRLSLVFPALLSRTLSLCTPKYDIYFCQSYAAEIFSLHSLWESLDLPSLFPFCWISGDACANDCWTPWLTFWCCVSYVTDFLKYSALQRNSRQATLVIIMSMSWQHSLLTVVPLVPCSTAGS